MQQNDGVNLLNNNGNTALMLAVKSGNLEMVSRLIDEGADVNLVSKNGGIALVLASILGNVEMVSCLIDKGADVNLRNSDGQTALVLASILGNVEMVSCLIDKGADVNLRNNGGDTALTLAASSGKVNMIFILLEAQANTNGVHGESYNLIKAVQIIPMILGNNLSNDEKSFYENNAKLVYKCLSEFDYNLFGLQKMFINTWLIENHKEGMKLFPSLEQSSDIKELEEYKKFIELLPDFEKKVENFEIQLQHLDKIAGAAIDTVKSSKYVLEKNVMLEVLKFLPVEDILKIGPELIEYSEKQSATKNIHQVEPVLDESVNLLNQFTSGALVGVFLVNPVIRYGRDQINEVNNYKTLDEYYKEAITLDNLSDTIAAFVLPVATQMIAYSFGIPYIVSDSPFSGIVSQISDSPFVQGLLQVTLIEGAMLTIDGVEMLGQMSMSQS